jgi:hypothetical protein
VPSDLVLPDLVPVLSRGKHRNPRKGACFMELASYLAGERWSDHPRCTHPLLAALARGVNDLTSDAGRAKLAELIPSVIGLTGDDVRIAEERQRILAISVLVAERLLASVEGRPAGSLEERSRWALAQAPMAAKWARRYTREVPPSPKGFRRYAAPTTVRNAVEGIARACIPDPDELLREVLASSIVECREIIGEVPNTEARTTTGPDQWVAACELTRTGSR